MAQWLTNERFGNGSNGASTISSNTTDAPTDTTCTGTSGTTTLSATNAGFSANQVILIHQTQGTGAGNWELNVISSYSAGTITTKYNLANTYGSGAQVVVVQQLSSLTINEGSTLTGDAWDGNRGGLLVRLVNGTITISGTISVNGSTGKTETEGGTGAYGVGYRGGNGNLSASEWAYQGESITGLGHNSGSAHDTGGGAGWVKTGSVGCQGVGGGGGNGSEGSVGLTAGGANAAGGNGGNTGGNATLTSILFGGGGGGAAETTGSATFSDGGGGGAGGGIVILIGKTIVVTGAITANGGQGGTTAGGWMAGCGAGGSILLKGQNITLGTTKVTATGGAGSQGGSGGNGRIHVDYSTSLTGTTTPTLDSAQSSLFFDGGGGALFGAI